MARTPRAARAASDRIDQFRAHVPIAAPLAAPVATVTKSNPVATRPATRIDVDALADQIVATMADTLAPIKKEIADLKRRIHALADPRAPTPRVATGDKLVDGLARASVSAYDELFAAYDLDDQTVAEMRHAHRQRMAAWRTAMREQFRDVLTFADRVH